MRAGRVEPALDDRGQDHDQARPVVRRPTDQHRVEDGAEAVDVRAHVGREAQGLLGGQVARRPEDRARGRERAAVDPPGQAEVDQAGSPLVVEHHVAGLEVAVQHTAGVGVLDPPRQRGRDRPRLGARERTLRQPGLEGAAGEEVLDEVRRRAVDDRLVDADDRGMVEPRQELRLAAEAGPLLGVLGAEEERLQRPARAGGEVLDLVQDPHPAAGQLAQDAVLPEVGAHRGRVAAAEEAAAASARASPSRPSAR
jgi:hypothetical protein